METDRLSKLIDQKHRILSHLYQLAERQAGFVQQGEMGYLLGLLTAKQKLLRGLQEIEQQLEPFRSQDPEQRTWRSPDARQQARDMAQRCESLLAQIMQIEKQCETELTQRRDATAHRLQGAHSAAEATEAYGAASSRRGVQLDISSGK